jgi:predicted AAA+ superfamily ATPase
MYYPREMRRCWQSAAKQFPVLLLTGPRQVGKTTFLQHLCEKKRKYVTLDDPALRNLAQEDPVLFLQRFAPPVLIDEIQYAPALLPHIKMIVDVKKQTGAFWLTGSQQFLMMKGISETLAGRIAILNLLGFSQRERHRLDLNVKPFLPNKIDLEKRQKIAAGTSLKKIYQNIWAGGFPALIAGPIKDRDLFYSSYLQTYLQRDVKDLTQVGDEAAFLRFLKACAARTGQMLNLSDLARDVDISVNTAKNWLSVLQASLQVWLLPPYHSNLTKRLVKRPKLYFLDTGLCSYLTVWTTPETLEAGAMSGAILETYVLAEILKSWWHRGKQPQLFYYRDKEGREIDFFLVQNRKIHPLEVKKSASPRSEWKQSFTALKTLDQHIATGGILCLSPELLPLDRKHYIISMGLI